MAEILHLFQAVSHGNPVREYDEVFAVENKGFKECKHGKRGSRRQVLLMDIETLEEFGIEPGRVKENVTVRGMRLAALAVGQQLRVGKALLEVTTECEPCRSLEKIRQGLQEAMQGRRGVLCRVLESGEIRRGDSVEVVGS